MNLNRRRGLTLVELLVVLAIITLLASLLLVALQNVRTTAQNLACYNDLVGLNTAVTVFSTGFGGPIQGPGFLPSSLDPSGGDPASQQFLQMLFPRTDGRLKLPPAKLQGDQVLVFLLAGPNGKGWYLSNPVDPTLPIGEPTVFYTFKPERLRDFAGNGYPSYLDIYGTPIAYFSPWQWNGKWWAPTGCGPDCPRLGVQPYAAAITSWQLISAGRDRTFGTSGAVWTYATATVVYPHGSPGADDMSNFTQFQLGVRGL